MLLAVYLLSYPTRLDPLGYQPQPAPPMTGVLAPNEALRAAELFAADKVDGPEDVAVDAAGRMYGGTRDGKIARVTAAGAVDTFAETGGRPLGLAWDADRNLIVADARKGLLSIDPKGRVSTLSAGTDGRPFGFTDDVDVAVDGRIYFSDASSKYGYGEHLLDMLESRPHGRLLRYDPSSQRTEVLLDGLYFANGVAVSKDNSYVLVVETARYRIERYWLRGAKAGTAELFADNLPGFPDGVSRGTHGRYWVAMFTTRNPAADWLAPRPFAKKMLSRLPKWMWPKPVPYGLVLALDHRGQITEALHDPDGSQVPTITSVEEHQGYLYLGSLEAHHIGRLKLVP